MTATVTVPPFIALKCRQNGYCVLQMDSYLHVTISNLWQPTILSTPRLLFPTLQTVQMPGELFGLSNPLDIHIRRTSSRHNPELLPTKLIYMGNTLVNDNRSVQIPVCRLVNAHQVLPSLYSQIVTAIHDEDYAPYLIHINSQDDPSPEDGEDVHLPTVVRRPARRLPIRELFEGSEPTAKKEPPVPQRVLNTFIESAVAKKETCPVSMNELETEGTRVTPCWHLISEMAVRWIEERGECPMCKQSCSIASLMRWCRL